jgi:hypothetical protein
LVLKQVVTADFLYTLAFPLALKKLKRVGRGRFCKRGSEGNKKARPDERALR